MTELRLIDPDDYTVPESVVTVSTGAEPAVRDYLINDLAPRHAAKWGYDARFYRVVPAA